MGGRGVGGGEGRGQRRAEGREGGGEGRGLFGNRPGSGGEGGTESDELQRGNAAMPVRLLGPECDLSA